MDRQTLILSAMAALSKVYGSSTEVQQALETLATMFNKETIQ